MRRFAVWFWDHGAWNEWANSRCRTRAEAAVLAQRMNRETCHAERATIFGGHRFRVRAVEE